MPLATEQNMIDATTVMSETAAEIKTVITDTNVATAAMLAEKNAFVAAGVDTFMNKAPIVIPDGADLNTYTDPGYYIQTLHAQAGTGTNYPTQFAGILEVKASSTGVGAHVYQTYHRFSTGEKHTRSGTKGGVFSPWQRMAIDKAPFTFSPRLTDSEGNGAGGYTNQSGYAYEIGGMGFFDIQITISSKGAMVATSEVFLNDLPWTRANGKGVFSPLNVGYVTALINPKSSFGGYVGQNNNYARISAVNAGGDVGLAPSSLRVSDLSDTAYFMASGAFPIA